MALTVYILSAVTSLACSLLLWRGYRANGLRLLFWSSLCFSGLALENVLLCADLAMSQERLFQALYNSVAFVSLLLLLFGLIWDEAR